MPDSDRRPIVRYYEVDWKNEKFPQRERTLYDWKDLTKGMSDDELLDLKKHIEEQIFKNLGS